MIRYKSKRLKIFFLFSILLNIWSCNSTKWLAREQYLLVENKIVMEHSDLKKTDLEPYIQQHPNRKTMGVMFHLHIYNLVDPEKEAIREEKRILKEDKMNARRRSKGKESKHRFKITRWLRSIGERPVIYSNISKTKTIRQMNLFLRNKGYYFADVKDSVLKKNKKITLFYLVNPQEAYRVDTIIYAIEDPAIDTINQQNIKKSFLKKNMPLDVDLLQNERNRIAEIMHNNGYFSFSKEYIFFDIDTSSGTSFVKLTLGIKNPQKKNSPESEDFHYRYRINNLYGYTDYNPKEALALEQAYFQKLDTVATDEMFFLVENGMNYRKNTIIRGLSFGTDSLFRKDNVKNTYKYLSSLQNFKLINIEFDDSPRSNPDSLPNLKYLDCHIKLAPSPRQSLTLELEGSNSSGKYGMASSILYRNRNLIRGAEIFDVKLKWILDNKEGIALRDDKYFNTVDIGVSAGVIIPQFVFPFKAEELNKRYAPKTTLLAAYIHRETSEFSLSTANFAAGYYWKGEHSTIHQVKLIDFFSTRLLNVDSAYFARSLTDGSFEQNFDHIIPAGNYSITFNNQRLNKQQNFIYSKFNIELAGNLVNLYNKKFDNPKKGFGDLFENIFYSIYSNFDEETRNNLVESQVSDFNATGVEYYTLFDRLYYQYIRSDIDFRYYQIMNDRNKIVYRLFLGSIYPYGNESSTPFSRQYYAGGASGVRAWRARTLGPGTLNADSYEELTGETEIPFYNRYGDIKIELNWEYRFKFFPMFESAFFVDAGNVWTWGGWDETAFDSSTFYKELGLGAGLGLRLDFSFFVFRLDVAAKLYDPAYDLGDRWQTWDTFRFPNLAYNFGIGYPF